MTLYPWIQFKSYLTSFNLWLVNRAHWKYKSSRRCSYFLHWLSVTQFSSSDSWESLQRFQCTSEQVRVFYTNGIYYITLFCTWKTFNTYFYRLLHTWFYWSASRKKKKKEGRATLYLNICLNLHSFELISNVTFASELSKMNIIALSL